MSTGMRTSCVSVVICTSVKRMASAPCVWMMSRGSTPLPRDFDIFCPKPSCTMAWMKTCLNGMRPPRKWRLNITMRLTQSVMISRAVERTALGFHFSRRPAMSKRAGSGQPSVESGQSAELNQVSSTSSSWR